MNRIKVIIICVFILLVLGVIMLFMNVGSNKEPHNLSATDITTESDTKFTYKDMMTEENGKLFEEKIAENPYNEEKKDFNDLLKKLNSKDTVAEENEVYSNEKQEMVQKLESEIKKMASNAKVNEHLINNGNESQPKQSKPYEYESTQEPVKQVVNKPIEAESPKRRSERAKSNTNQLNITQIIAGVIDNGNKGLKNGSTVRIRIVEPCIINGINVDKNTMITGIATISEERLDIKVNEINYGGNFMKCDLSVYDNDGVKGLFVPGGNLKRDIKTEIAQDAVNDADQYVEVPVVGRIGTNILKKKISDPTIIVNDNHKVSLRIN
jgi:hypothetical protein